MRALLLILIAFLQYSFISTGEKDKFRQDVSVIHSSDQGLPQGAIDRIQLSNNVPLATASGKAYQWNGKQWAQSKNSSNLPSVSQFKKLPEGAGKVLSEVTFKDKIYIGCENGLYVKDKKSKWKQVLPFDENYSWALKKVAALVVDSSGNLWFGSKEGIGKNSNGTWQLYTGKEGVPYTKFTCASAGPGGEVWFGTENGAIRAENDYFYYRSTRRWLPDNRVNDIAIDKDGSAWIATDKGIGQILSKEMTYEEKAAYFTQQTEERHNRMGFICQNQLSEQFNIDSYELAISDNDGQYTSMYGAAQAFRYAITGDREAKEIADRSFKAVKWLVDITPEPGFPARVIIPVDWHEPVNEQYSKEYNKRNQKNDPFWKDIYPRFPLSEDGKYRWKCDTSSDELAGHYFYYGVYYDLVAETEEEKKAVKQVVADVTDHLIRHSFKLVDYDGKPTRWGSFDPDYFNSIWGWDQRGLNSMMMLSFLNVASHVTEDPKYDEVAKMLRDEENYHINAMHPKEFFPPENVVPWDNNLGLMSFYGLINYEKDPELLMMYRLSLEYAWLNISKQKNAFWDGLYGALANTFTKKVNEGYFNTSELFKENPLFAQSVIDRYGKSSLDTKYIKETLQRIPLDLIGYEVDNTHRLDVIFDPTPAQEADMGWRVDTYALPIDERGHVRLDRDAFDLHDSEGNGYSEHEGTFYLLPYYFAKYHNLIPH
ncbi:two-component regulator propeller domain-containing protein [Kriegella aquimaris]|uniref:Two component regulator propeller n=1 Tax=Kriegella aquimaris TaxID=192904 RepID=A0A1G9N460_9FLAO|nr:two-component regulator propeller domain-containing protein [Kriegella aquimaris]SDL81346.1 Two component regulator propeller [Kriegella aquimaris]